MDAVCVIQRISKVFLGCDDGDTLRIRYYFAGTPNLPSSCPSLVFLAVMHGIYKSNAPLLIKKTFY